MDGGDGALEHAGGAEVGVTEGGVGAVGEVGDLELLF